MVGPRLCTMSPGDKMLLELTIGQRIEYHGYFGTIKYIGEVLPTKGTWLGIDWDDPSRGKHNGAYEGVQYFKSIHLSSGSFVRPEKVNVGDNCLNAIKMRYGEVKDDETAGVDLTNLALLQKEMNASFLQVVGFDKVNKKQSQFVEMSMVCVRNCCVNGAGPSGALLNLCPNVRELDLSLNLLSSWHSIIQIASQLKHLRFLNVSENQLLIPEDLVATHKAFGCLEHIVLRKMGYSWSQLLECINMWPQIQQLQVPFNNIMGLDVPHPDVLWNLKVLDLEGNMIGHWEEINKLGKLLNLEVLNVADVGVSNIYFPTNKPTEKTELFPALKQLRISNNHLHKWTSFCELNKLQQLIELRIRDNPILQLENMDTCRQLIIARISNLKILNATIVTHDERRGAEYDYLKKHGKLWLSLRKELSSNVDDINYLEFTNTHPRYAELVEKYGACEEGELTTQSNILKTKLIRVEIFSPNTPSKTYVKKIPQTMMVSTLTGLTQRLFNTGSELPSLFYISSKTPKVEFPFTNNLKELSYYSIEDGDRISVHW